MSAQFYRLTRATLGILNQDGHKTPIRIPAGATIEVTLESLDTNRLVDVRWEDKTVTMFTMDLLDRGESVIGTAAGVGNPHDAGQRQDK